jgi:hypothetical protein
MSCSFRRSLPLEISKRSNGLLFNPQEVSSCQVLYGSKQQQSSTRTVVHQGTAQYFQSLLSTSDEEEFNRLTSTSGEAHTYKSLLSRGHVSSSRTSLNSRASKKSRNSYRSKSQCSSIRSKASVTFEYFAGWNKVSCLSDLPVEVLEEIFAFLDQPSLLSMLCVSKSLYQLTLRALYASPRFSSTYRFAQFVTTISTNKDMAKLLHHLNLSTIRIKYIDGIMLAGWRDWKLGNEPLYSISASQLSLKKKRLGSISNSEGSFTRTTSEDDISSLLSLSQESPSLSREDHHLSEADADSTHPLLSPFLKQFSECRDLPIGAILHILGSCPGISKVDLSYLPLTEDHFVRPQTKSLSDRIDELLFASDFPRARSYLPLDSYNWKDDEISTASPKHVIEALICLENLSVLVLRKVTWITKSLVIRFVTESKSVKNQTLKIVDLRDSGMVRSAPWAIRANVDILKRILEV